MCFTGLKSRRHMQCDPNGALFFNEALLMRAHGLTIHCDLGRAYR